MNDIVEFKAIVGLSIIITKAYSFYPINHIKTISRRIFSKTNKKSH